MLIFHLPPRPHGTAYHLDGAYLMLRFAICEEKSSGIDKVNQASGKQGRGDFPNHPGGHGHGNDPQTCLFRHKSVLMKKPPI
jgi:hypothetical protein